MNDDAALGEDRGRDWKRKTFSLPTSLAEWVDRRAARGEASAYIAALIEADQRREQARAELRCFGYSGDMEITAEGRAAARVLLDRNAASRAGGPPRPEQCR